MNLSCQNWPSFKWFLWACAFDTAEACSKPSCWKLRDGTKEAVKVKLSAKESGVDEGNESLCPSHLCAHVWKSCFRECLTDLRAGLQTLIYRTLDSPLCASYNWLCLAFNTAEPDKTWFHTTSKALGQPQLRPPSFFFSKRWCFCAAQFQLGCLGICPLYSISPVWEYTGHFVVYMHLVPLLKWCKKTVSILKPPNQETSPHWPPSLPNYPQISPKVWCPGGTWTLQCTPIAINAGMFRCWLGLGVFANMRPMRFCLPNSHT